MAHAKPSDDIFESENDDESDFEDHVSVDSDVDDIQLVFSDSDEDTEMVDDTSGESHSPVGAENNMSNQATIQMAAPTIPSRRVQPSRLVKSIAPETYLCDVPEICEPDVHPSVVTSKPHALVHTKPHRRKAPAAASTNVPEDAYVGKDKTVWSKEPSSEDRVHNISKDAGSCTNIPVASAITKPVDAILLFLRPIITLLVLYTNMEAKRVFIEKKFKTAWKSIDEEEMYAFIGLILTAGILQLSKETLTILWSARYGPPVFRATMSHHRFKEIQRYMRFDDKSKRSIKDKFAPFREVFNLFNNLLVSFYIPGKNMTVDEQLIPYRGKCGFRQYNPKKPVKYGIKIWWLCDAENYYPLLGHTYLGREKNKTTQLEVTHQVVVSLTEPYQGTNRNVTCDNYFTDLILAESMLKNGLTLVGTVRQSKKFLPNEFKPNKNRPIESSVFGYQHDATLVSYVPDEGKAMTLLSTLHHDGSIDLKTKKPEILMFYDSTKGGVDNLDQLVKTYTCIRVSKRWPMTCFYNMLDVVGVAAYVIWNKTYPNWTPNKKYNRRDFLIDVSESLIERHMERRYQACNNKTTRDVIHSILGGPVLPTTEDAANSGKD